MESLVSIIIPLHNAQLFIKETINNIVVQTYTNWELIIVNDGSNDDSLSEVKKITDDRMRVYTIENSGAAFARNFGFKNAKGDYIYFLDADDLISKDFIEKQLGCIYGKSKTIAISGWGRFYKNQNTDFVEEYTPSEVIDFKQWISRYWKACNPMTTPGRVMMHRSIIEAAGIWNEDLNLNDDLEFFTRIFLQVETIVMNPNVLLYYRSGINGLSGKKDKSAYYSLYKSVSLSVDYVMSRYLQDKDIKESCANMLQSCIYEIYPKEPLLIKKIENKIIQYGGSSLKPETGGITLFFDKLFGWKFTRKLKFLLNI